MSETFIKPLVTTVNCSSLNRIALTSASCGGCQSNYIGSKDTRTVCISIFNSTSANKGCPNDCNGNGTCIYNDINTGNVIDSCNILSSTCISKCLCNAGLSGSSCDTTIAELKAFQSKQEVSY